MVKRLGRSLLALLLVAAFGCAPGSFLGQPESTPVPQMSVRDLDARLGEKGLVIIDVRLAEDWAASKTKIPGAVREDPRDLGFWAQHYPKTDTIVLYCA